ncbi:MAG TPA: prephenate dehydratase [Candidatus Limnocylindrales bacterium]|nr:prephenate dehydratase [Candidatus Limnocylindrales bacterium]
MSLAKPNSRVAFQGERGAFSEEAAVKLLGEKIVAVPQPTFDATFAAVGRGLADLVLSPIENSLAGSVHPALDLLVESGLRIIGEVVIPISMNLIALPGATLEQITAVESHPVALAQCEKFFRAHPGLKRIVAEDTAGSVREIMQAGDPSRAAIAGRRAAEIYGGKVLLEHLEDNAENYTRFLLLSVWANGAAPANKLSLVFQLPHRPGSLHRALEVFARRNINLMKIESRPVHGHPWEYRFYIDLQAPSSDPEVAAAIEELRKHVENLKILGSYMSAEVQGGKSN